LLKIEVLMKMASKYTPVTEKDGKLTLWTFIPERKAAAYDTSSIHNS